LISDKNKKQEMATKQKKNKKNKAKYHSLNSFGMLFASPGAERSAHTKQTEIIENTKINCAKCGAEA